MRAQTININLFGGPGVGKSQTLSGLFNKMKMQGHNTDITLEYAKELVYAKEWLKLSDQLAIAGEQHHRMFRLLGNVDYAIHDSPFIMGIQYCCDNKIPVAHFNDFLVEQFNRYKNLNILLKRNLNFDYKTEGRLQNQEESIIIDNNIQKLLDTNKIPYHEVYVDDNVIDNIYKLIKETK